MKPPKFAEGVIAQELDKDECIDEKNGIVLAFLKMFPNGQIGLLWSPVLFVDPAPQLPDDLRAELIKMLRFHAARLEDKSLDVRMKELHGKMGGEA